MSLINIELNVKLDMEALGFYLFIQSPGHVMEKMSKISLLLLLHPAVMFYSNLHVLRKQTLSKFPPPGSSLTYKHAQHLCLGALIKSRKKQSPGTML